MEYFKKSLNFAIKNYLLIIPLYIAIAIPQLIMFATVGDISAKVMEMVQSVIADPEAFMSDPMSLLSMAAGLSANTGLISFLSIVLTIIAYPALYGMIKKGLRDGTTGLDQFVDSLKNNIVRYILYFIGLIVLLIIIVIGCGIIILLLGLLANLIGVIGIVLLVLAGLAALILGIYFGLRLTLWLPAMIIDELGIMDGLKKGFRLTKGVVAPILGITLLVSIISGILSLVLSFLNKIPVIGPLLLAVIPAGTAYVLAVFYMLIYQERSKKAGATAPADATAE